MYFHNITAIQFCNVIICLNIVKKSISYLHLKTAHTSTFSTLCLDFKIYLNDQKPSRYNL